MATRTTRCEFLARLARNGPVLELAIGTGRIGLPLAARGMQVTGIEISPAMAARLRAKPGGGDIAVTMGDFADVAVPGTYRLAYVVYNTFFNLLTQDDQVRCFENVAAHLTDDGVFVVEAFVPAFLYGLRNDQYVDTESIAVDEVRLDLLRHDPVAQLIDESHVSCPGGCASSRSSAVRVAQRTRPDGAHRRVAPGHRWGGWNREPFTSASDLHVSVYGR